MVPFQKVQTECKSFQKLIAPVCGTKHVFVTYCDKGPQVTHVAIAGGIISQYTRRISLLLTLVLSFRVITKISYSYSYCDITNTY